MTVFYVQFKADLHKLVIPKKIEIKKPTVMSMNLFITYFFKNIQWLLYLT